MSRFEVPPGWALAKLGEVAQVSGGLTKNGPKRKHASKKVPLVSVAAVQLKRISREDIGSIGLLPEDGDRGELRAEDLLLVEGNGSLSHIGRVALWDGSVSEARHQNHIIRIRPRRLSSQYLLEWLASPLGRNAIVAEATSAAGLYTLSLSKVERLPVLVPPLKEQRRIVAKLESLLARSSNAKKALDSIGELEQRALGCFVHGWPEGELGDHLVEHDECIGDRWNELPLLGLSNEGAIVPRREAIGAKTAHKCKIVAPGDIVFNPIRFSIGSVARYYGDVNAIVSPEYVVMRTRETFSAEVLRRFLRSSLGRSVLETETQGSVRYRVYFDNLRRLRVPIAPPQIQAKAERFFLRLNKLLRVGNEIAQRFEDLDRALVAKAFRGELVSQDPADEPASVLLERIRADRDRASSSEPVTRTKRRRETKVA